MTHSVTLSALLQTNEKDKFSCVNRAAHPSWGWGLVSLSSYTGQGWAHPYPGKEFGQELGYPPPPPRKELGPENDVDLPHPQPV